MRRSHWDQKYDVCKTGMAAICSNKKGSVQMTLAVIRTHYVMVISALRAKYTVSVDEMTVLFKIRMINQQYHM